MQETSKLKQTYLDEKWEVSKTKSMPQKGGMLIILIQKIDFKAGV